MTLRGKRIFWCTSLRSAKRTAYCEGELRFIHSWSRIWAIAVPAEWRLNESGHCIHGKVVTCLECVTRISGSSWIFLQAFWLRISWFFSALPTEVRDAVFKQTDAVSFHTFYSPVASQQLKPSWTWRICEFLSRRNISWPDEWTSDFSSHRLGT